MRRVLVTGAGVAGRGVAAALVAEGAHVTVADGDADRLAALAADLGVETAHAPDGPPEGTDLVVTSPGWRPDNPLLLAAAAAGVEVVGDVELAWRLGARLPRPPVWLAVTGTNGKTSTVLMLESMLRAHGLDAVACGNVGLPVVDAVRAGHEVLAVELSSFQLHWQSSMRAHASVVLNLAEDHLDWHGGMDAYAGAKAAVHTGAKFVVHNLDDDWSTRLTEGHDGTKVGFSLSTPRPGELGLVEDLLVDRAYIAEPATSAEELFTLADVRPQVPHAVSNALAAAALARACGVTPEAVRQGLLDYRPGAHRSVRVGAVDGVLYVNDSKATNPHAAASSLRGFESAVWIAGGLLKGASVDELVAEVAGRLRGVVLIGRDAGVIAAALARHAPEVPVHRVAAGDDGAMTAAVNAARAMARPGDVVLLAPAAASMDMFRDYAHRGEAFAAAVGAQAPAPGGAGVG
ncbi:UDP-N-acetylmuramoyl-L-alanine--D-glutamate ligase [Actinokineospora sp. G85]|uniref:UDP-N-acetylmuramoyl-L-alanine--D-glutamate ligase n=1 Tax=Actinokineospora sp. G85 TaxID=3406626 RepID=UPI003C75888F